MKIGVAAMLTAAAVVRAQEAGSGFELRSTVSAQGVYSEASQEAPRSGDGYTGGVRVMLYPTWKISSHWTMTGALQASSRPYFFEQLGTQGYGIKGDLIQAHLDYSRYWSKNSVVIRAGFLSTTFGSFMLRYDDAVNPLIGVPLGVGYYYQPVSALGMAGVQADVTLNKVDLRAQFTNSSPANRRSVFDADQYPNWTGGVGYTIRQGLRVGASAYRGPYLDRDYPFFFPGESNPRGLPATGMGVDVQWGSGPWNVTGEAQRFRMTYNAIPDFTQHLAYGEVRRTLHPRWYVAARVGYLRASAFPGHQAYEGAVGFRPNASQIVKVGYVAEQGPGIPGALRNTVAVQVVTTLRPLSFAR